jgi:dihydroorotate dehydrogenase
MLYKIFKKVAFKLDPEFVHVWTLKGLNLTHRRGKLHFMAGEVPDKHAVEVLGLKFSNPVGLAAGLDKNGDHIDALGGLGFGAIEIGTVTPRPQPGNPKPRLFRIPEQEAIINRMGFNNKGVDHLVEQVKRAHYGGVLGINIGKNFDTPNENALDDYLIGMRKVYRYADYITVNISSPNTKGLRELQSGAAFEELVVGLKQEQQSLADSIGAYVPLAIKIAPDLEDAEIKLMAETMLKHKIDAVIATNTTIRRDGLEAYDVAKEAGGLSGFPVQDMATEVIKKLHAVLGDEMPIMGVGGIMDAADAREKLNAGAKLVQVYSGLIYRGPGIVGEIVRGL